MRYDPLGNLAAVKHAKADEMAQPEPRWAVLAACQLFEAVAEREARKYQKLMDMQNRQKED